MEREAGRLNRREFVRVTMAGLAGVCAAPAMQRAWGSGIGGVARSRLDRLAKGANVCRWFRFVRESPEHFHNYINEAEARLMRQMGLTHVRVCVQPKVLMDQSTGAVRAETAGFLDAAIERFHRADLLVLIDLHNEERPAE